LQVEDGKPLGVAVKMPVFPFDRFPGADPILGPEMRSTGEVMGLGLSFGEAFAKAALAAGIRLPQSGQVFLSLADPDKPRAKALASRFRELGFHLLATRGTATVLREAGFAVGVVKKVSEGRPHAVDLMVNGEIQLVVNTPASGTAHQDGQLIRRGALEHAIPYVATVPGAFALAEAITCRHLSVAPLQTWMANALGPSKAGQSVVG
jgi:carbamoyl-phosphate synthase large subunit